MVADTRRRAPRARRQRRRVLFRLSLHAQPPGRECRGSVVRVVHTVGRRHIVAPGDNWRILWPRRVPKPVLWRRRQVAPAIIVAHSPLFLCWSMYTPLTPTTTTTTTTSPSQECPLSMSTCLACVIGDGGARGSGRIAGKARRKSFRAAQAMSCCEAAMESKRVVRTWLWGRCGVWLGSGDRRAGYRLALFSLV